MKKLFTVLNVLGTIVFAYFAWLQREDDNPEIYVNPSVIDAWTWIIFYGLIAACFVLALRGFYPLALYGVAVLFCLFELVMTGPGVIANLSSGGGFEMTKESMAPHRAHVELTREFFGALIALAAVGFLFWQRRWVKKTVD